MLAIVLSLGTSLTWGASNFLGPLLARRHGSALVLAVSQSAALLVTVVLLLGAGEGPPSAEAVGIGLLAGVFNAGGLIGFYKAAELAPIAIVAPVGALGAVVPAVVGIASGDTLGVLTACGIALAIGGGVVAARAKGAEVEDAEAADPERARRGTLWALGSAVAFGGFLAILPEASDDSALWALLDARVTMVALTFAWAWTGLRGARPERGWLTLTVPGLLLVAGTILYAEAVDRGDLAVVSVLSTLFPLVTGTLGFVVLRERLSPLQAAGSAAALAGVVLVAV